MVFVCTCVRWRARCSVGTGVQTCALPIFGGGGGPVAVAADDLLDRSGDRRAGAFDRLDLGVELNVDAKLLGPPVPLVEDVFALARVEFLIGPQDQLVEIGRASCRERVCQNG